jgi:endoglucanase
MTLAADLRLNELEYLEMPGLNVMLAHDDYPEGHQGGVGILQHGRRVATNGDLRLSPTPGQWDPVPRSGEREIDAGRGEISVRMAYPDPSKNRTGFNPIEYPDLELHYRLRVRPVGGSTFRIEVDLDEPLPADWVGKVGFNLELFPGLLFGQTWLMDDRPGMFPRQANGPGALNAEGRYQLAPLATGRSLVIAPGSETQRMRVDLLHGGELSLLDGRAEHSNGWFVLRSLVPAGATAGAVVWELTAATLPHWHQSPTLQVSQVGYHPDQSKRVVIELDPADPDRPPVVLERILADGRVEIASTGAATEFGRFLRYQYLHYDFSEAREEGLYRVRYGGQVSHVFPVARGIYRRHVWQPTLETFLPVQMCHLRVNDRYRVWHGACHLDDARMAPVDHHHFDGYRQGPGTLCAFSPGEPVPGLNRGGWHDAGDYDLRVESQAGTMHGLALAYEEFHVTYDNTTVDQALGVVELHRPDGKPDILQQIEHGALSVLGGYDALGRLYRGIIAPTLRQYTHLGDASTQTDNQPSADDRWVFTEENPRRELEVAGYLAASARALRDYDAQLADRCLEVAQTLWELTDGDRPAWRVLAAVELLLATGEARYADFLRANVATVCEEIQHTGWLVVRVLDRIDDEDFVAQVRKALEDYAAELAAIEAQSPYGVPYEPEIWGAGWKIQRFGMRHYFLHRGFPEIFPRETIFHALNFILGVHPGTNTESFVSGVGADSLEVAYGVNRADWSFIPGGSGSGTALIRPDFPELLEWPFLWQQSEYVMGGGTTDYLFLALAAEAMLGP